MSVCSSPPYWLLIGQLRWHQHSSLVHWSLLVCTLSLSLKSSNLHISLPLLIMSWWYSARCMGNINFSQWEGEIVTLGQWETWWAWWVRVTSGHSCGDHHQAGSPNMGQTRLMNVGCHTASDMDSRAGFFKYPPTNIFIVTTRHSLHFSSSSVLRLAVHVYTGLLRCMGCSDVWMSGLCGAVG